MNEYYYPWNPFAAERSALKRDANYIGLMWLSLTVLINLFFTLVLLVLQVLGVADLRANDSYLGLGSMGYLAAYAVSYCVGMGCPAPIVTAIAKRRVRPFSRYEGPGEEEKQLRPFSIFLALMAGLAICILANFVTDYILTILSRFGIQAPSMPSNLENSASSLLANIFVVAVFPAILEEMVFRGYFLRALLPYGDGFAIFLSALLFALMHGNILQIPFAFIIGLTNGYLVVYTGSIWPAVMLHFLNNFMSLLLEYEQIGRTDAQNQLMTILVFALIGMIGLISLLILFATDDPIVRHTKPRLRGGLTGGQKAGAVLTSPALLISLILAVVLTVISTVKGVA